MNAPAPLPPRNGGPVDLAPMLGAARAAAAILAQTSTEDRRRGLRSAAARIRAEAGHVLAANARDLEAARAAGLAPALLDRLALDRGRLEAMAGGVEAVAGLDDPLGEVMARFERPNGLVIEQVRVPIGVIAIVFEARPNVTADAAALCLMAGNAAILRAGSEADASARAIHAAFVSGLARGGLPVSAVQMVPDAGRAWVGALLAAQGGVDMLVPRGGKSLVARVQQEARVPVLAHLDGICHLYVDRAADLDMAARLAVNAKMRRPGICGAMETLLIDRAIAHAAPRLLAALAEAGAELRVGPGLEGAHPRAVPATDQDWDTEYLDAICSVALVDGVEGAMAHIARHGSGHTDSIVTADEPTARRFLAEVDSAIVMWNASTQFADGGEFGFGAEIGISTGRLHARGPVALQGLTTYKYRVLGSGQCRP